MSSDFRLICLSHDPGLLAGPEYDWTNDPDAALAVAAHPAFRAEYGHPGCDLVVGRFCYPLVEVACPASVRDGRARCPGYHPHNAQWTDAYWLRLLALTDRTPTVPALAEAAKASRPPCWPAPRLARLAGLLGLEPVPEPLPPPARAFDPPTGPPPTVHLRPVGLGNPASCCGRAPHEIPRADVVVAMPAGTAVCSGPVTP